jgi:MFS family permease
VYGWPALRRDLIKEGGLTEKELGAVFTCGAWSVQGGRFAAGLIRDSLGTRRTACGCLLAVLIGAVLIATVPSDNFAGLAFGMLFLGLGSGAQLCIQPVTGLFPENASAAMATLSGAFQISGLVFLVCSGIARGGAERIGAYLLYAGCVCVLLVLSWMYLPYGFKFTLDENDENDAKGKDEEVGHLDEEKATSASATALPVVLSDGKTRVAATGKEGTHTKAAPVNEKPPPPLSHLTRRGQLFSDEYVALLAWFSFCVTPAQYYVQSIGWQLERKGDDDGAYTSAFVVLYAASAALAPIGGAVADKYGVGFAQGVATVLTGSSFLVLLSDSLPAQIAGMTLYSIGRLFVFALFFSNIGRRFGFAHYGTLVGFGMLTSAVLSMLQYPMFTLAIDESVDWVNVACAVAIAGCLPYTVWLSRREAREKREFAEKKAERSDAGSVEGTTVSSRA